jgi:hypothetical protein
MMRGTIVPLRTCIVFYCYRAIIDWPTVPFLWLILPVLWFSQYGSDPKSTNVNEYTLMTVTNIRSRLSLVPAGVRRDRKMCVVVADIVHLNLEIARCLVIYSSLAYVSFNLLLLWPAVACVVMRGNILP